MLTATFQVFSGIGESAERRLWERGCCLWEHALHLPDKWLSVKRRASMAREIREARIALETGMLDYFLNRLEGMARARVLPHCLDDALYLDIETTGLGRDDTITTLALFDGRKTHVFVEGINLNEALRHFADARLLVSFNGSRFDLPRLRKRFGIDLAMPHLDLMPALAAGGWRGGLKAIECQLGIKRNAESLDGAHAVVLWREYSETGDTAMLHRLLHYNAMDARNLGRIVRRLYTRSMQGFPMTSDLPPSPAKTPVWFQTDHLFEI